MKNCFLVAVRIRLRFLRKGKKAKLSYLISNGSFFPHFIVRRKGYFIDYQAYTKPLPWYKKLHFAGYLRYRKWKPKVIARRRRK